MASTYFKLIYDNVTKNFETAYIFSYYVNGNTVSPWLLKTLSGFHSGTYTKHVESITASNISITSLELPDKLIGNNNTSASVFEGDIKSTYVFSQSNLRVLTGQTTVFYTTGDMTADTTYYAFVSNSNNVNTHNVDVSDESTNLYISGLTSSTTYQTVRVDNAGNIVTFDSNIMVKYPYANSLETLIDNNLDIEYVEGFFIIVSTKEQCKMYAKEFLFAFDMDAGWSSIITLEPGENKVFVKLGVDNTNYGNVYIYSTAGTENKHDKSFYITFTNFNIVEEQISNVGIVNTITLQQMKETVYSNAVVRPVVKMNSEYSYVDDIRDTSREYTHRSVINTTVGKKEFGVRTVRNHTTNNIIAYDVDATVVELIPTTFQQYIYTFRNGPTYMQLSSDLINNGVTEILGHYRYSYEYINENINDDTYYGVKFTYAKPQMTYVVTDLSDNNNSSTYVKYAYDYDGDDIYVLDNQNYAFEPITGTLFEPIYTEISLTYIQQLSSYINPDNMVGQIWIENNDIYDKFTYTEHIIDNDGNGTAVPFTYYMKTNSLSGTGMSNKYMVNYDWELIDNTNVETSYRVLYTKVADGLLYMPQQMGIVTDGTVIYYKNSYVECSDAELTYYKTNETPVYIKQEYREISESEFNTYKYSQKIYICKNTVQAITIQSSRLVSELSNDNNVVYGKTVNEAIDRQEYDDIVHNTLNHIDNISGDNVINKYTKNVNSVLQINENSDNFTATNNQLKYILDYSGSWEELPVYSNTEYPTDGTTLYIKEEGYNQLPSNSLISVGSGIKYYKYCLNKVDPRSITTFANGDVYMDATYLVPANFNASKILKVNAYGFLVADTTTETTLEYYNRITQYEVTSDLYKHPNKQYYISTPNITRHDSDYIPCTDFETHVNGLDKDIISIIPDSISYYKKEIERYNMWSEDTNIKEYTSISDIVNGQFDKDNDIIFLYSRYFYNTYTNNSGLEYDPIGAYYTNIFVFDGVRGVTTQKQFLTQNTYTVTNYTYNQVITTPLIVTNEASVHDIAPIHYSDYMLTYKVAETGKVIRTIQLDEYTYSPKYWFDIIQNQENSNPKYIYELYKNSEVVTECKYTGSQVTGAYQYIDTVTLEPKVCIYDDMMLGIIFRNNNYLTRNSSFVGTTYEYNYSVNDVSVEFEPVELYEIIHENTGITVQDAETLHKNIEKNIPFTIANDITYTMLDTYTWHNPTHASYLMFDGSTYTFRNIEYNNGYWTRDYQESVVPLTVASYQFYVNSDAISNITSTYSFTPNSYVVTAIIEHPEITYDYLTSKYEEYIYYTYVYEGETFFYGLHDPVQDNGDGTYVGLAFSHNSPNAAYHPSRAVNLIKHISVEQNVMTNKIVEQEAHTTYQYLAYKTSIALTNEKVPVLYNIEKQPATSHNVLIWDPIESTYIIESRIDSYSYYSYQYWYDTIPFQTASYIYQASYLTIDNFNILGTYIAYAIGDMSTYFNAQAFSVDRMSDTLSAIMRISYDAEVALAEANGLRIESLTYTINDAVTTTIGTTNSMLNTIDVSINDKISELSDKTYSSVQEHMEATVESISDMREEYTYQETTSREQISYDITNAAASISASLGGDITLPSYVFAYSDPYGAVAYYNVAEEQKLNGIGEVMAKSFIRSETTYTTHVENGITYMTRNFTYQGIAEILDDLHISTRIPTKQEFICNVSTTLFTNTDFENEIVDNIVYDDRGNIIKKISHKNLPVDMAKKSIYRASVLWAELGKAGIVPYDEENDNPIEMTPVVSQPPLGTSTKK